MGKILSRQEWQRRKRIKEIIMMVAAFLLMIVIIIVIAVFIVKIIKGNSQTGNPAGSIENENSMEAITTLSDKIIIKKDYLTPNQYSRPQISLNQVNGVVIHYTANPGTSAKSNRSYFQSLAKNKSTKASSHYIIGLTGEILQCIPLTEVAYASNERNDDTISIECCHPDETGEFNEKTYDSLITLVAGLCMEYDLKEEAIIRHYDVNGKLCPLYYVNNEEAWIKLKADVTKEVNLLESEIES